MNVCMYVMQESYLRKQKKCYGHCMYQCVIAVLPSRSCMLTFNTFVHKHHAVNNT
jgi:hypothetical protein